MSHDALEKLVFSAKSTSESEQVMPDLLHFDTVMRKPGVTRQLLWMKYKAQAGVLSMGYSHLCSLSMRQEHRAGEKLFIDFSGPTIPIVNPDSRPGETAETLDCLHHLATASLTVVSLPAKPASTITRHSCLALWLPFTRCLSSHSCHGSRSPGLGCIFAR